MIGRLRQFVTRLVVSNSATGVVHPRIVNKRMSANATSQPDPRASRLIWIDLEMTGLDVSKHVIVEIATIVTEADLTIVAEGPDLVIQTSPEDMANIDAWPKKTFKKNGLLKGIADSNITMVQAEAQTLAFLEKHTPVGACPLAGNTVYMDRRFLNKYMPLIDRHMHYRIVDVSSFKEAIVRWRPDIEEFKKKRPHRALDDIKESIDELKHYKSVFFDNTAS